MTIATPRTWRNVLTAALVSSDELGAEATLIQICLAYSELSPDYLFQARPGGLPSGRPPREIAREAAGRLVQARGSISNVIGLLHLHVTPVIDDPSNSETVTDALRCSRDALQIAEMLKNDDLIAWALLHIGELLKRDARHAEAVVAFEASLSAIDSAIRNDAESVILQAAGFASWLDSALVWRHELGTLSARKLGLVAAAAGNYTSWTRSFDTQIMHATVVAARYPRDYALALAGLGQHARITGNREKLLMVEAKLAQFAMEVSVEDRDSVARVGYATRVSNASFMKDWTLHQEINAERLAFHCESVRRQALTSGVDIGTTPRESIEWLASKGDRTWRAGIGNSALSLAQGMYRLGLADQNESDWDQANSYLDLANVAFRNFGSNGFVGSFATRARLMHTAPGGPRQPLEVTVGQLLAASRRSKDGDTGRNALLDAVRICVPGDPAVLERAMEMASIESSVHRSRLLAAVVIWSRRSPDVDPIRVEELALVAARELEPEGRLQDSILAVDCWSAAATAGELLGRSSEVILDRWLNAVRCLAAQLISITSTVERAALGRGYSAVLSSAADLAIQVGDVRAAEFIMEAVRRDRVGSLLAGLVRDPRVSESVRESAERVLLANAAQAEVSNSLPPDPTMRGAWMMDAGAAVDEHRRRATTQARDVIGPLAVLADLTSIKAISSADLLGLGNPDRPAAVLQLLTNSGGIMHPAEAGVHQLYWVVSTREIGGPIVQHCGMTPLPVDPATLNPDSGSFWSELFQLSSVLLPPPLIEFLRHHGPADPITLSVVPTGLLAIPFDGLLVDEDTGSQVVDCATVSTIGSIATASAIATAKSPSEVRGGWLAVYDTHLPGAQRELDAMHSLHLRVQTIDTKSDLDDELCGPISAEVLAMAVHGSRDDAGWGQTKLLPDGSTLRAVDILRWQVPQTCVLASCHSTLMSTDGVELSGFPIAMLLRGAHTVIGSIHEIDDQATADIMERYWHHSISGHKPSDALRLAKLDYLEHDPDRRLRPGHWSGLIAYGYQ